MLSANEFMGPLWCWYIWNQPVRTDERSIPTGQPNYRSILRKVFHFKNNRAGIRTIPGFPLCVDYYFDGDYFIEASSFLILSRFRLKEE